MSAEAKKHLQRYGYNKNQERKVNPVKRFLYYFLSPIPWMDDRGSSPHLCKYTN